MKGWSLTYFSGVPGSTQNLLTSILTDLWFCEKGYLLDLVLLHSSSNWKFNQCLFWTILGGQQNSAAVVLVSPLMTNGWTMWYFAVSAWPLAMNSLLSILELLMSEESGQLSSTSMKTVSSVCTSYPTWCWDASPRGEKLFSPVHICDHLSTANSNDGVIGPDLAHIGTHCETWNWAIEHWLLILLWTLDKRFDLMAPKPFNCPVTFKPLRWLLNLVSFWSFRYITEIHTVTVSKYVWKLVHGKAYCYGQAYCYF